MESSVELQPMLSYAVWPLIVCGALLAAAIIVLVVLRVQLVRRERMADIQMLMKKPLDKNRVKRKYLAELEKIGMDFEQGQLDIRGAYQQMSMCIRGFVHAMTGIRVQNYTLNDIEELNMPVLYDLVAEYYTPEFAFRSEGDVRDSIARTRSMIERWV